jgi:hypothetical protein
VGTVPGLFDEADEVHVSVTFTWDLPLAEKLARAWEPVAPVRIGGPATGEHGGRFDVGMYLKPGYVITSRGCPNACWFCSVPQREGRLLRTLPVRPGRNVLDDNLLACPEDHQRAVFAMLKEQKKFGRIEFTGGLEAAKLQEWHIAELREIRPKQMFFAYDTPDDLPHLKRAGEMLLDAGWTIESHTLRAYVLCGWPENPRRKIKADTFVAAERRMREVIAAGFMPMAMLYRDETGNRCQEWMRWQKQWARPVLIARAS